MLLQMFRGKEGSPPVPVPAPVAQKRQPILQPHLAGDTDLAGNLSGHQVKIVPWFRAFRPYFLSFQSPFSIAAAYYQSRNLVRKLSSYGRWFWLAFTPSCQPHHDRCQPHHHVNHPSSSSREVQQFGSV